MMSGLEKANGHPAAESFQTPFRTPQNLSGSPGVSAFRSEIIIPYLLISLLAFFCHGFLLTNDGTYWDSWYYLNLLETRNWPTIYGFFDALGMPLYAWFYWPFAYSPDIVASFMWATFFTLLADGVLTYQLAVRLGQLTRGESLAFVFLVQSMPFFNAAQDLCMFFYVFTHMLFLAAALLACISLEIKGWRHVAVRSLAVLVFYVSFSNAALLVFYGGAFLLLFIRYRQLRGLSFFTASWRFLFGYPELLLLPPVAWMVRIYFMPQHGWYEKHNLPGAHLKSLVPNFLSFFQNVVPYHVKKLASWPGDHPVALSLMLAAVILFSLFLPEKWRVKRSSVSNLNLVWFALISLFLGVFPFAAAGKWFSTDPVRDESRFCILVGVPLALLLLALLRLVLLRSMKTGRWLLPVAGCFALILASQINSVYVAERVTWIFSRALLLNATRNEVVRNSSVVVLQGFNVVMNDANGLYGFASAFGGLTRLVTHNVPENNQFFTPQEIEKLLMMTTFPPNDFRRIDPSGMQIYLAARRNRGGASDQEIVFRYLKLRYFGSPNELDRYVSSLVTLNTYVIKPAIPFKVSSAVALPDSGKPEPGVSGANFTNGSGMRMVLLPGGWWASKYETTQAQYAQIMGGSNPSLFKDPLRPVDSVSWYEAVEFCKRVTDLETKAGRLPPGFVYRLPTSQEFDSMVADASPGTAVTSTGQIRWYSEPAGSMPPNSLGLHDVIGNVWEWCLEWGDAAQRMKISKGESWTNYPWGRLPNTRDPVYDQTIFDRLYKPVRKDYPDQGFWNRGFRCIIARDKSSQASLMAQP